MTKQEATAFLMTLNTMRPFNPPMYFDGLVSSPICRVLELVAAGSVEVKVSPVEAVAAPEGDATKTEPAKD